MDQRGSHSFPDPSEIKRRRFRLPVQSKELLWQGLRRRPGAHLEGKAAGICPRNPRHALPAKPRSFSCRSTPVGRERRQIAGPPPQSRAGGTGKGGRGVQHIRPDRNSGVLQDPPSSHLSLFKLSWKIKEQKAKSQELKLQLVVGPYEKRSPFLPEPQDLTPHITLSSHKHSLQPGVSNLPIGQ